MKRFDWTIAMLSVAALLAGACGEGDLHATGDACQDAAQHMAACLGTQVPVTTESCDPLSAENVLGLDCGQINATLEGKADRAGVKEIFAEFFSHSWFRVNNRIDCSGHLTDRVQCNQACTDH